MKGIRHMLQVHIQMLQVYIQTLQVYIQTLTLAGMVFGHFDELVTMQGADDHHINIQ